MITNDHQAHSVSHYIQIWATILILFVVSITIAQVSYERPFVLVTSFGIAMVQAFLVAAYFMHLREEKAYITYLLISMLLALVLLYAGTMGDVNHSAGKNWEATDTAKIIQDNADWEDKLNEAANGEASSEAHGEAHGKAAH